MAENKQADRTYNNYIIRQCCWAKGEHAGNWIVQTYHQTGTPWSDECCPHFRTLKEAKTYTQSAKSTF